LPIVGIGTTDVNIVVSALIGRARILASSSRSPVVG
jgi:hypothetical protein